MGTNSDYILTLAVSTDGRNTIHANIFTCLSTATSMWWEGGGGDPLFVKNCLEQIFETKNIVSIDARNNEYANLLTSIPLISAL